MTAASTPGSGSRRTGASSLADPEPQAEARPAVAAGRVATTALVRGALTVRGTMIQMAISGQGAPLLFLHGAGAAGRWLPFHERLAGHFQVHLPCHPGHGGSPAAEWIEHISDLAFHYLDLLDELGLERVHLVGASFGGWIAAELATMASHRL